MAFFLASKRKVRSAFYLTQLADSLFRTGSQMLGNIIQLDCQRTLSQGYFDSPMCVCA